MFGFGYNFFLFSFFVKAFSVAGIWMQILTYVYLDHTFSRIIVKYILSFLACIEISNKLPQEILKF